MSHYREIVVESRRFSGPSRFLGLRSPVEKPDTSIRDLIRNGLFEPGDYLPWRSARQFPEDTWFSNIFIYFLYEKSVTPVVVIGRNHLAAAVVIG
jgi:hypothetical protein